MPFPICLPRRRLRRVIPRRGWPSSPRFLPQTHLHPENKPQGGGTASSTRFWRDWLHPQCERTAVKNDNQLLPFSHLIGRSHTHVTQTTAFESCEACVIMGLSLNSI